MQINQEYIYVYSLLQSITLKPLIILCIEFNVTVLNFEYIKVCW